LIEHLDDERLTRGRMDGFNNFSSYQLQVRHVVSDLLERLAGREIDRDWLSRQQGYAVKKDAAKKWWDEARKIGEEAYLLKHVLTANGEDQERAQLNGQQFQVIMARYPERLPALFRTILDKRLDGDIIDLMYDAIANAIMPAKIKLELLREATRNKDSAHYTSAFLALKKVDPKEFNALLLTAIEAIPEDVPGRYPDCREVILGWVVMESDDPRVWSAIEKVAKRSVVGLRMELLHQFGFPKEESHRRERLRLLAAFLDDTTIRDTSSSNKFFTYGRRLKNIGLQYEKLSVRDFAALELAGLLGIDVELKPERTADEWVQIRTQVRETLDRELSKRK